MDGLPNNLRKLPRGVPVTSSELWDAIEHNFAQCLVGVLDRDGEPAETMQGVAILTSDEELVEDLLPEERFQVQQIFQQFIQGGAQLQIIGDDTWIAAAVAGLAWQVSHIGPGAESFQVIIKAGEHLNIPSAGTISIDAKGHVRAPVEITINHNAPAVEVANTVTVKGSGCLTGSGTLTFDTYGHYNSTTKTIELELDTTASPSGGADLTPFNAVTGFEWDGSQLIVKYRPVTLNVKKNACGVVLDVSLTLGTEAQWTVATTEQCP